LVLQYWSMLGYHTRCDSGMIVCRCTWNLNVQDGGSLSLSYVSCWRFCSWVFVIDVLCCSREVLGIDLGEKGHLKNVLLWPWWLLINIRIRNLDLLNILRMTYWSIYLTYTKCYNNDDILKWTKIYWKMSNGDDHSVDIRPYL